MKFTKNKLILIFSMLLTITNIINSQSEELQVNILPSDKYKLNSRDLTSLKSDIERQMMQRVFEIQSSWDEREKLRQFAISRPPVRPPWPIVAPAYQPDQVTRVPASWDDNKVNNNNNAGNNSGHAAFSFIQGEENERRENMNQERNNNEENGKNDQTDNMEKLISVKNSLEDEIKETQKEIRQIKLENNMTNNNKENSINLRRDKNKNKNINQSYTMSIDKVYDIDYDLKAKEIYESLKNYKNVDLGFIKKMIVGKNKNEIESLIKLIKFHPEIVQSGKVNISSKELNNDKINQKDKIIKEQNYISPLPISTSNSTSTSKINSKSSPPTVVTSSINLHKFKQKLSTLPYQSKIVVNKKINSSTYNNKINHNGPINILDSN